METLSTHVSYDTAEHGRPPEPPTSTPRFGVGQGLGAITAPDGRVLGKRTRLANTAAMRPPADLTARALPTITLNEAARAFMLEYRREGGNAGRLLETDKRLSGSTINRHIAALASVYKYAHTHGLLSPDVVSPTRGIRRLHEEVHADRYIRVEEFERLVIVGRALDRKWGKFAALLTMAFYTGLRRGDLLSRKWEQVDLKAQTIIVGKTKNGEPIVQPLHSRVVDELLKVPGTRAQGAFVFCHLKPCTAFDFDRLWDKAFEHAGIARRNFHQLRHGLGSVLATSGQSQAAIMKVMGHKSLLASARYMHLSTSDKRHALERAFG